MEDIDNCVFAKSAQQIFYKKVLDTYTLHDLQEELGSNNVNFKNNDTNLATRKRLQSNVVNEEIIDEVKERIQTVLRDYFHMVEIMDIKFYRQVLGETKKHIDKSLDGKSNYTLLVYLSDDFDGGELILKCKRTDEEMEELEKDKKHIQFTIKPKEGYGIIFDKTYYIGHPKYMAVRN